MRVTDGRELSCEADRCDKADWCESGERDRTEAAIRANRSLITGCDDVTGMDASGAETILGLQICGMSLGRLDLK